VKLSHSTDEINIDTIVDIIELKAVEICVEIAAPPSQLIYDEYTVSGKMRR